MKIFRSRENSVFRKTYSILFSRKSSAVWRFPGGHLQVGAYGSDPIEDKCLQTLALWPVPIPGRRPLIGFQIARAQAPFQREARGEGSFIFQLGCVHSKGYQASQNFDEKLIFLSQHSAQDMATNRSPPPGQRRRSGNPLLPPPACWHHGGPFSNFPAHLCGKATFSRQKNCAGRRRRGEKEGAGRHAISEEGKNSR